MLDRDLARLYDVSTAAFNQAVRRNRERFPEDFMFQLTSVEVAELNRSQIVIGSEKHRDPRFRPYAFTEQGVAMLSSVLRSRRAISVNIEIMRAFVKLRQMLASNVELSRRLDELESKYDKQFRVVFDAIRQLMTTPARGRKEIGFRSRAVKKWVSWVSLLALNRTVWEIPWISTFQFAADGAELFRCQIGAWKF
jgi:hypothetical protein